MQDINILVKGKTSFGNALMLQEELREDVRQGRSAGAVFLLEHDPPVVTLGRRAGSSDLLLSREEFYARGIQVEKVSRGGDVTAHEPGQLVIYYILPASSKKAGSFVKKVVEGLSSFIYELSQVKVTYRESMPGLWCGKRKVGSLGFDLTGGVSMHGAAINISNSLETFRYINPCGSDSSIMTTVERESGRSFNMEEVYELGKGWPWYL